MYSSKHINSDAFVKETKLALGIPETVPVGIAYRTILDKYGSDKWAPLAIICKQSGTILGKSHELVRATVAHFYQRNKTRLCKEGQSGLILKKVGNLYQIRVN